MTFSSAQRRLVLHAGGWLASLAFTACAPTPTPNAQVGTLGNGSFNYACISDDDPDCTLGTTPAAIPTIALGGTFDITYASTNSSDPTATVLAVSPEYFVNQGESFTAILTGTPSFVAETPAGAVLDYTTVTVASIDSIVVSDTTAGSSEPYHSYLATAMGAVNEPLGGHVLYTWTSSDPSVLTLQGGQETPSSSVHVVWLKNGTATLTATSGSVSGSLSINVSTGE